MDTCTYLEPFDRFREWFEEAKASVSTPYPNAMCLSTATSSGAPSSRIVLLKGMDDTGFTFFTNMNSRKSQQIRETQTVALNFFWVELGKQIRIEGQAELVGEQENDAYFATRPRESQLGAWASQQSSAMTERQELKDRFAAVSKEYEGKDVPRPPHWGGWLVVPSRFEFWEEGAHRLHKRTAYIRTMEGWFTETLYP